MEGRRILAAHRRNGQPLSLAMLDLDFFKKFNDTHGHQAGDRLLKEASAAWREELRETDLLARWGGEEFAALLPMSRGHHAVEVMERLRNVMPDGCTCSVGVTEVPADDDLDDAVQRADAALYEAKAAGRNRVVLVDAMASATS
jgi:diguanylate cyclase (GGDEF)-like protein